MRKLYPAIEPYQSGFLDVGEGHRMYWEVCGNPQGRPIVFLHGGPGSGCIASHRSLFDPAAYRIVLFDQRGCGRSQPNAAVEANTTWHLVADLEKLRDHLSIEKWVVFGGSWGSCLALAYAQTHTNRVTGLIVRGVFLLRKKEISWFYQYGASLIYPDYWEDFIKPIPSEERHDMVRAFHSRLFGSDQSVQIDAARAWAMWEARTITLLPNKTFTRDFISDQFALAFARIENHYFYHAGFMEEGQLLSNAGRLAKIPGIIIQGRYDMCTPMQSAYDLAQNWPQADFQIIDDAGHAFSEPGIQAALIEATDAFR